MLIDDMFLLLLFIGIGIFFVLNGLRYFKYGKLVVFTPEIYNEDMYGGFAAFSLIGGTLFIIFPMIGFFFGLKLIGIVLDAILAIVFTAIFYWYWHTEKDPFAFDKVWEDPRDKKKKEPK